MKPIVFAQPRATRRALEWLWVQIILAAIAGLIIAAFTHQNTKKFSFWSLTFASGAAVFFIGYFVVHRLLTPRPRRDTIRGESDGLTTSITSSLKSAYAVSSNWLDLWRAPSFSYYLHLDATTSLVAYSGLLDSPLGRLSANPSDQEEFYRYGLELVRKIAAGEAPITPHRLRLLIYPSWVYAVHGDTIRQLIKSHSAGRIPCVPLVAEQLDASLSASEKAKITELAAALHQNARDKMPPRAPIFEWCLFVAVLFGRLRRRLGPTFPDILLVDADLPGDTAKAWWYGRNGKIGNWSRNDEEGLSLVSDIVTRICSHAGASIWPEYASTTVGHVAVTPPVKRSESEAFFGRDYYEKWLEWIKAHERFEPDEPSHDAAHQISEWLDAEDEALVSFVEALPSQDAPLRLLDVGCGFGRHLLAITANHSLDAVGIDINDRMIAKALDAVHSRGEALGHVAFVVGDGALMGQLQPQTFDAAICMTNTLGNMPPEKQRAMLQRLSAVLRPGAPFLLSVYGEGSSDARHRSYTAIGLRVEEKDSRIVAAEGLSSECFARRRLERLLTDNGLIPESVESSGIGLIAVARTPCD